MQAASLYLYPQPSRYLLAYQAMLHIGAGLCIFLTDLPVFLEIFLIMLCAGHFYYYYYYYLNNKHITYISINSNNQCYLVNQKGLIGTGNIYVDSIASTWFIILNFKGDNPKKKRFSLVLPLDALSPNDYRRLRVCLFTLNNAGLLIQP